MVYNRLNLDLITDWVVLPILKWPLILIIALRIHLEQIYLNILFIYSVSLWIFLQINDWYKRRNVSGKFWLNIEDMAEPVAIVTGGSQGLGRAIICNLLLRFSNLKIINIDIVPMANDIENNSRISYFQCDLANCEQLEATITKIKNDYGNKICLLINNAGMRLRYNKLESLKLDYLSRIMQVNCFSSLRFMQEFSKETNQLYIVNIASTLGVVSPAKVGAYAASKAALISLHNSFSFEISNSSCKSSKVRMLLVLTGQLDTELFQGFEPPRKFFAPVVNVLELSNKITEMIDLGYRGILKVPFYANFVNLLMSLPMLIQDFLRGFAKMDTCLPDEDSHFE